MTWGFMFALAGSRAASRVTTITRRIILAFMGFARTKNLSVASASLAACLLLAGCGGADTGPEPARQEVGTMEITSAAFVHGEGIPTRHTCDGEDLSPPLAWSGAPEGTRSFALICDDPDAPAGTWVHWVIFGVPADSSGLAEGVPPEETLESGARQGKNDFKRLGWGGPCPPRGKPHRYFFRLYALDTVPGIPPGSTKERLLDAVEGHVLAEGVLIGTYARK
jgi:hypothetical protein